MATEKQPKQDPQKEKNPKTPARGWNIFTGSKTYEELNKESPAQERIIKALGTLCGGALVLLTGGIFLGAWKLTEKGIKYAASFDKDFAFGLNQALALYGVKGKT